MAYRGSMTKILFSKEKSGSSTLAFAEINNPKSLNAIDLEMYLLLSEKFEEWRHDEEISAIVIHSQQERAFSAGGDVKWVVKNLMKGENAEAMKIFTEEYCFDLLLTQYPKPVIGFANGFCMGGGLGLLQACDVRWSSDLALLAMPEVKIGFFPDVGASYFLPRLLEPYGLFLGLTGGNVTAQEALKLNLVDRLFRAGDKPQVFKALAGLPWSGEKEKDVIMVKDHFSRFSTDAHTETNLFDVHDKLSELCQGDLPTMNERFKKFQPQSKAEEWVGECLRSYFSASPLSQAVVYELLTSKKSSSWRDAYEKDWILAYTHAHLDSDMREGARAVLFDKDHNPQWQTLDPTKLPAQVEEYFVLPEGVASPVAAVNAI